MQILANDLKRQYGLHAAEYEAKALEVLRLHLLGGQVVSKYTLSAAQEQNA